MALWGVVALSLLNFILPAVLDDGMDHHGRGVRALGGADRG